MISLNFSNGCAPDSMRPLMKNAGVPFTPTFGAVRHVLVDRRRVRLLREALVELRRVEAELLGVRLQLVVAERRLIGEQLLVVLPELALRVGAGGGLRGRPRVRRGTAAGSRGRRRFTLSPYVVDHLSTDVLGALAERALVVRELDDGDRRVRAAALLGTARRSRPRPPARFSLIAVLYFPLSSSMYASPPPLAPSAPSGTRRCAASPARASGPASCSLFSS